MNNCAVCDKKITCCKCGKLMCESNGTVKTFGVNDNLIRPCKMIGYYKIAEEIICIGCHSHYPCKNN